MGDGAFGTCAKCILILINVFFLIIGLLFIAGGVVLKFLPQFIPLDEFQENINNSQGGGVNDFDLGSLVNNTAIALIVIGAVIFVIAILGMCGACCNSPWMLIGYGIIVLLLLVLQVVAVALVATGVANEEIRTKINETIQEEYGGIERINVPSVVLNAIMLVFKCCGIDDYTDFHGSKNWMRQRYVLRNGQNVTVTLEIPLACCKIKGDFPSIEPVDNRCLTAPDDTNSNWKQGCFAKFQEEVINKYKTPIIVGVSVLLSFEFLLAVMALAIAVKKAKRKERW